MLVRSLALLTILTACAVPPPAAHVGDRSSGTVRVIGAEGEPIVGARVDWIDGGLPCDVDAPLVATYTWSAHALTDEDGGAAIAHPGRHHARVVSTDGRAAIAIIDTTDPSASITVHPIAHVVLAPTCGGTACRAVTAYGSIITSDGAACDLHFSSNESIGAPTGTLALTVAADPDEDDQAFGTLATTLDHDVTLSPALDRVGGPEVVRGSMLMPDGRAPTGPDYTSHVSVDCGPGLRRDVDVEASTGAFIVRHLPARTCTLHATHDDDDRWERTIEITPGRDRDVTVELARGGW